MVRYTDITRLVCSEFRVRKHAHMVIRMIHLYILVNVYKPSRKGNVSNNFRRSDMYMHF